tara:strand:- start:3575 stop:4729 length:1155 start_codon:yes stop_codon:yes gene_type:complete
MKKKLLIISSSRADYDLIEPVFLNLRNYKTINSKILLTGSHYDKKFGYTFKDILKSGHKIDFSIKMNFNGLSKKKIIKNMSVYIRKLSFYLEKKKINIVLILGDRYETIFSALVANFHNICVAHISGGEVTEGSQDDCFRHAISKLSHIHFVSHNKYKKRLIQLGEKKTNIFNYGSLGLENIHSIKFLKKQEIEKNFNIKFNKVNFLTTYHPETIDTKNNLKNLKILIDSLLHFDNTNIFITSPNADFGSDEIINYIHKIKKKNKNIFFLKSLGKVKYFSLLHHCDLYLGNSSSGVTEVPHLKNYSINLGNRQQGRIYLNNVINIPFNKNKIINKIKELNKKKKFNFKSKKANSASKKIAKKISDINLNSYVPKKFIDLKNFIK